MSENKTWRDKICWLSVAEKLAALVLFLGFAFATRLWWSPIDSDPPLQFIALSFLVLIVALITVWLFGIPLTNTNDIDLESVARDRIKATVAILAMITLLGGASLIVLGVTLSNSESQSRVNTNEPPTEEGAGRPSPDGTKPPGRSCEGANQSGDGVLNRAELDDALKQAMAPLIAQFDACKQLLDRAADDGESPPPVKVQADVSCREFEALLPENEESGRGVPGTTSVLDVIGKGFDIGGKLLATRTETKGVFLDRFLDEFAKEFGGELGGGTGKAVHKLGKLVYAKLTTTKRKLTMNVWVVRFDAIGSITGPGLDRQLNEVIEVITKQGIDADCSMNISGHTDTLGSDLFNRKLSERRAKEAADRIQAGLPGVKVRYQGWGERRLQTMTDNSVANTDNRRVEIEVTCRP